MREMHGSHDSERQKNMVMGPAGPETKSDCPGEGQRQITRPDQRSAYRALVENFKERDY
jgi:hypothetical protein